MTLQFKEGWRSSIPTELLYYMLTIWGPYITGEETKLLELVLFRGSYGALDFQSENQA